MSEKLPINPALLKWARETAGLQLADVARKMGKDIGIISSWEHGDCTPTYVQLEKLAYTVYKRPLALFFFPEPPREESIRQEFRTLPDREIDTMSPRIHYLLKQALAMQINLAELNDFENPAKQNIIRELTFKPGATVSKMAAKVRDYLGIDLDKQFRFNRMDEAFKSWRHTLETHGVFIFKESFKDDSISGFCLHDNQFPVIYINNSVAKSRQIFSIFHELAHLLLGTGGIDTRNDDYIDALSGDNKKIEILCNRFAGAFLVPDSDFYPRISDTEINDESLWDLADKYKVSREVILRKCLDKKRVSREYYSKKTEQWIAEAKNMKTKKKGGSYYANKGVYLGEGYLSLAFKKYFQQKISVNQLADYLGVKVKSIPGMESLLFSKSGEI